jgi:hypothetical protein
VRRSNFDLYLRCLKEAQKSNACYLRAYPVFAPNVRKDEILDGPPFRNISAADLLPLAVELARDSGDVLNLLIVVESSNPCE